MTKPVPKMNLIHAQILAALLEGKRLAANVSWASVDQAAKRWTP